LRGRAPADMTVRIIRRGVNMGFILALFAACAAFTSCKTNPVTATANAPAAAPVEAVPTAPQPPPPAGFSGELAFNQVAKLVAFGPHPPASDAIHKTQEYIIGQLKGFGCAVDVDDFHASTPVGSVAMKNIVAKIPGSSPNIIILATHYDTDTIDKDGKKMTNFVGADDGGSSTGLMLEMARVLCGKPQPANIWIAFLDGEEAFKQWDNDRDSVFGSRELAATLAVSGDLARVKAFVLADLVGGKNLHLRREENSTPWLADLVWGVAARLGHQNIFIPEKSGPIEDDHLPFIARKIPVVDIIDLDTTNDVTYWHTEQDTLDKISAKSLQVVGDVIFASIPEIVKRVH
jgi:glutaminyl-peptide cyclotransferase